jgi:NADH-quinone oxidoreductase subunit E
LKLDRLREGVSLMGCSCGERKEWTCKDQTIDLSQLEPTLEQYAGIDGSLITILQKAQDLYGYLPVDLIAYIAHRAGISPAKVMGVVTFYTQFRTKPVGKNLILLCQGTACHVNGSAAIETAVREELGVEEGEITQDGLFTFSNVACLGCCSLSPVMMIGGETYGTLTPQKAKQIIQSIRQGAAV